MLLNLEYIFVNLLRSFKRITLKIFLREQIACLDNTNNILYSERKKKEGDRICYSNNIYVCHTNIGRYKKLRISEFGYSILQFEANKLQSIFVRLRICLLPREIVNT